jgi:S-DNA-T family DNA segregation ATPase FtsK/SpoIIIE
LRLTLTAVDAQSGAAQDLLLDVDGSTPVETVARALGHALGLPTAIDEQAPRVFVAGRAVDPGMSVHDSPLREASVVSLGGAGRSAAEEPVGEVEVRVVGGRGAGRVHRLDLGDYAIGSNPQCDIRVADPEVPGHAVHLRVGIDGRCTVRAAAPAASARLDGAPLEAATVWPTGGQMTLGGVLLELARATAPDAALHPSQDGAALDYNRPPRLQSAPGPVRLRLPAPPAAPERRPANPVALITPMIMALAFVLILHSYFSLIFALASPITWFLSRSVDQRSGRKTYIAAQKAYDERRARVEVESRHALAAESAARREASPDAAAMLVTALGPRTRLWERRAQDDDFLQLRLGTADLPSQVVLESAAGEEEDRETVLTATDVPVTVSLPELGVLGLAGQAEMVRAAAWSLVAQCAVLHSPADLQIVLLSGPSGQQDWDWLRWLPHARPIAGADCVALIGTESDSLGRRVAELAAQVSARRQAVATRTALGPVADDPTLVVVLDGARRLRSMPGLVQVLRDGPSVGVYAVCLDTEERFLPEESRAVLLASRNATRLRRMAAPAVDAVRVDEVDLRWCRSVARAIGPIRDVGAGGSDAVLPASVHLLDLLGLRRGDADQIARGWSRGGRSTGAVVGATLDGPLTLDLRRDGPHALVAGTTGSGKSELLQTWVASLAVANRPDTMAFVLVDYKGGSAFKECVALPHTVGMVTDLDAHLVERAITSLSAELRRREQLLADAGAKDIDAYVTMQQRDPGQPPLPRLVIVIDEFASMVRDLPDFVSGLVNLAQRGRSLGIHLVLATQRPAGVVTADIRANTNLRIALRVTDVTESSDVLDAPNSARIAIGTPGRGHVRTGHGTLLPFQTGYVGGRDSATAQAADTAPWVVPLGWQELGQPVPLRPRDPSEGTEPTDLGVLVDQIRDAARSLGIASAPSPWLPPLPERVLLDDLAGDDPSQQATARYGLLDLPEQQAQRALAFDLDGMGHLHIVGSARSGRSQTLRTVAAALARTHGTADLHLYGIDCGNGALLALDDLPHCGAVVTRSQPERLTRLVGRLVELAARRQEQLAVQGFVDLTEQRASVPPEQRLPHVVVLLDRWEGFVAAFGETLGSRLVDQVMSLLQDGGSVGVHLVITGDRSLLSTRIATTTGSRLLLRLTDRADYALAGIDPRKVPEEMPPGRALRAEDGAEAQIALLTEDATGPGQAAALRLLAQQTAVRDTTVPSGHRPFRVDVLPSRLTFDQAWQYRTVTTPDPLWGLVGVGGDELTALGVDLAVTPSFLIAGPQRSGRSTALAAVTRSVLAGGAAALVLAPRNSPLRGLAGHPRVRVFDQPTMPAAELEALMAQTPGPVVLVVDDAEVLTDPQLGAVFSRVIGRMAGPGRAIVAAGATSFLASGLSGWQAEARRGRSGVLLNPQSPLDGDVIGVQLPRTSSGSEAVSGRALLHLGDGRLLTVQIPEPGWT